MTKREKSIHKYIVIYIILFSAISLSAEDNRAGKIDLFLLTGYGLPLGGFTNDTLLCSKKFEYDSVNQQYEFTEAKDHYLNYGHGVQIEAGLDYYLLNNLSMEFSFSLTGGLPLIKVKYEHPDGNIKYTETYKRNMIGFDIKLIPHIETITAFDLYLGVGAGLHFAFLTIENTDKKTFKYEGSFKTNPAISFTGLLGFDLPLSEKVSAFFEASFKQMSFKLKSRQTTSSPTEIIY